VPYKPKTPSVMATPNVIPMADIMLVLLIIFMVITPLLHPVSVVKMAAAENADKMPDTDRDDAVVIAVTRDGRIFMSPGNKEVPLAVVSTTVKDFLADRLDKTVYIRSDARTKYGDVVKAVDEARSAGVENLGLLTEKLSLKTAPSPPPAL
jgi:biopolymer transport protein TolR